MSAVIKTSTPFVIESVLFKALVKSGAEPQKITVENQLNLRQNNTILIGDILTNRSDYYGRQVFRRLVQPQGERWVLLHDSSEMHGKIVTQLANRQYASVSRFLSDLSQLYEQGYQEHLAQLAKEDRLRLENERKARVEATRQQAIIKAKAQGYSVKESRTALGQIQLVLTRTV